MASRPGKGCDLRGGRVQRPFAASGAGPHRPRRSPSLCSKHELIAVDAELPRETSRPLPPFAGRHDVPHRRYVRDPVGTPPTTRLTLLGYFATSVAVRPTRSPEHLHQQIGGVDLVGLELRQLDVCLAIINVPRDRGRLDGPAWASRKPWRAGLASIRSHSSSRACRRRAFDRAVCTTPPSAASTHQARQAPGRRRRA